MSQYFVQIAHCPSCKKEGISDGDYDGQTEHVFYPLSFGTRFVEYKSACTKCQMGYEENDHGVMEAYVEHFHYGKIAREDWDIIAKEIKLVDD